MNLGVKMYVDLNKMKTLIKEMFKTSDYEFSVTIP